MLHKLAEESQFVREAVKKFAESCFDKLVEVLEEEGN